MTTTSVRISRRILVRYLLDDETPVVATRQHWARLAEPFGTALVALLVVGALASPPEVRASHLGTVLWLGWLLVAARAVWHLLEWRNEWFVATDRRMLMVYGLVTHKVAMMPLRKVTDMNYGRSLMGRLLGYGQFVLESAGQDQAMRRIRWVPDPDEKYRRICATIFGGEGDDEDDTGGRRAVASFDEHVEEEPWDTTFDDEGPNVVDRFDHDIVHVPVPRRPARDTGEQRGEPRRRPRRPERWQPVERSEVPSDWEWVEEEEGRGSRTTSRRRGPAVDPDPTPHT